MSEEAALIAAIVANPGDHLCRLVYCDWLEERGQNEKAAFIRKQLAKVKDDDGSQVRYFAGEVVPRLGPLTNIVTFDNVAGGFVESVQCSMLQWFGSKCDVCNGFGVMVNGRDTITCTFCGGCVPDYHQGRGEIEGIGKAAVATHPIRKLYITDVHADRDRDHYFLRLPPYAPFSVVRICPHRFPRLSDVRDWLTQIMIAWAKGEAK